MVVVIKGLKKLNANVFEDINISEDKEKNEYLVRVFGGNNFKNSILVGNKFSEQVKGMCCEERVIEVIQRYLENVKINGVTSLIGSAHRKGKWIYVYGNNGSKILRLQLFNDKFGEVFRLINNKYINDRYDLFWNDDVKKIKLSISTKKSSYTVLPIECEDCDRDIKCFDDVDAIRTCETYVDYTVKIFQKEGISLTEKLFITELLNYKFGQVGEEVLVKNITIGPEDSLNRRFHSHIIRCGDFELSFPHREEFMFIFDIVNNYNNELFEIKMNEKKRQLKMEGF